MFISAVNLYIFNTEICGDRLAFSVSLKLGSQVDEFVLNFSSLFFSLEVAFCCNILSVQSLST